MLREVGNLLAYFLVFYKYTIALAVVLFTTWYSFFAYAIDGKAQWSTVAFAVVVHAAIAWFAFKSGRETSDD